MLGEHDECIAPVVKSPFEFIDEVAVDQDSSGWTAASPSGVIVATSISTSCVPSLAGRPAMELTRTHRSAVAELSRESDRVMGGCVDAIPAFPPNGVR
jgi:hypothetical protein